MMAITFRMMMRCAPERKPTLSRRWGETDVHVETIQRNANQPYDNKVNEGEPRRAGTCRKKSVTNRDDPRRAEIMRFTFRLHPAVCLCDFSLAHRKSSQKTILILNLLIEEKIAWLRFLGNYARLWHHHMTVRTVH